MLENDDLADFVSLLWKAARANDETPVDTILGRIENIARQRLSDLNVPLPAESRREDPAERTDRQARKPARATWDLTKLGGRYGIDHLLRTLQADYENVRRGLANGRKERDLLRWFPAANVLRHCLFAREYGVSDTTVRWLAETLQDLMVHEQTIGMKIRGGQRVRGPSVQTRKTIAAMSACMTRMKNPSVSLAAKRVHEHEGHGTSTVGNRKAWVRHARKLGHIA